MPVARLATLGLCAAALCPGRLAWAEDLNAPPFGPVEQIAPVVPGGPTAPTAPLGPIAPTSLTATPVGLYDGPFLRTPGDEIIVFPEASLQIDGAFFSRQTPKSGVYMRRARVGLSGWLGSWFYFDLSADLAPAPPAGTDVAPSALPAADDYLAFAPAGDRLIVQVGQFDAPFTLENRTSDAYTDFIERSMAARTLGAPRNKEVGAMLHGIVADDRLYYSAGLFNGEGPGFRNDDNQADAIGRVAISPFESSAAAWRRFSIGASAWIGNHVSGPMFPVQATPGGLVFVTPHWVSGQTAPLPLELNEQGSVAAVGGELSLPIGSRFGLRGELVWKRQHLAESEASLPADAASPPLGDVVLHGIAGYAEAWFWLLGDDRLLPVPGRELPRRLAPSDGPRFDSGLMLAVRGEVLKEDFDTDNPALSDPSTATTRVVSGTAGATYWRGRFVRLSANYVVNTWSGTSETILALVARGKLEQEFLLRFAMSL
jgi:hypothetical protein